MVIIGLGVLVTGTLGVLFPVLWEFWLLGALLQGQSLNKQTEFGQTPHSLVTGVCSNVDCILVGLRRLRRRLEMAKNPRMHFASTSRSNRGGQRSERGRPNAVVVKRN